MTYDYLKPYVLQKGPLEFPYNSFGPLYPGEMEEAEKVLGGSFPPQLKEFYQEIGVGRLMKPHNPPAGYDFCNLNEILPPLVVANFAKGILRWEGQDNWMAEPTYEFMEPGDLPFFEIGDSSRFLFMKPRSDTPNAIWNIGNIKIEDSFERFIHRLYYENPWFYDDVIEAHNK